MSDEAAYIHGTAPDEQARLAKLGELTDAAFLQFVRVRTTDKILDVGSGLGNFASRVASEVIHGEVVGIERSEAQLARALQKSQPNLRFQAGDAHALPFEAGEFDVVYCRYLLEHVADPVRVLQEMHRVLKPGGKAYVQENDILIHVTDPPCPAFERLWAQFAVLQQQIGGDGQIGRRLFALMRQAGFVEIVPSLQPEVHAFGMTTFEPWIRNLAHIARDAAPAMTTRGLTTVTEAAAAIAEFEALLTNPDACAWFYWNRVTGAKGS